jgi:7-carboxy-7-deazaguanine synthase
MIDPKLLRNSAQDVRENLARRGFDFDADAYLALEEKRKALQIDTENLQSERNTRSKAIGQAKAKGEDIAPLLDAVADLGDRLEAGQNDLHTVQTELRDIELGLPNLLHDDVPDGSDDEDNIEIRRCGEKPKFEFEARDHCRIETSPGSGTFSYLPNPLSLSTIERLVGDWQAQLPHQSLSITGGEPLLHAETLCSWLPVLREHMPILLETNGLLTTHLAEILPHVDFISTDIKLPSVSGQNSLWSQHEAFLRELIAVDGQVKVVVSAQTNPAEISHAARLAQDAAPHLPFILQPETRAGSPAISGERLLEWQCLASRSHAQVRVIPQMHPLLGLL